MVKGTEEKIGFVDSIKTIIEALKLSWAVSKKSVMTYHVGTILDITGIILSTYAGAKVIGLLFSALQNSSLKSSVWTWLAIAVFGQLLTTVGHWLKEYNRKVFYLLINLWANDAYFKQMSRIDINDFYNPESRNTINKLKTGFNFRVADCVYRSHTVVSELVKTLAIIITIGTVAWWVIPLLIIFLLPSSLIEAAVAKFSWGIWDTKGDEKHVSWD